MPSRRLQSQSRRQIRHEIHMSDITKHTPAPKSQLAKAIIQINVRIALVGTTRFHETRSGIQPKFQRCAGGEPDSATSDVRERQGRGLAWRRELDGAVLWDRLVCRAVWWGWRVVFCFSVAGKEEEFVLVVHVVAGDIAEDIVVGGVVLDLDWQGCRRWWCSHVILGHLVLFLSDTFLVRCM